HEQSVCFRIHRVRVQPLPYRSPDRRDKSFVKRRLDLLRPA
ncbi:conserved hypothetical protein, partial [delta proteobacterium NaphS2]